MTTRECAWSGEEFEGKAYVLNTTEGPEVVSGKALRETRGTTDKAARSRAEELHTAMEELAGRLSAVERELASVQSLVESKGSTKR